MSREHKAKTRIKRQKDLIKNYLQKPGDYFAHARKEIAPLLPHDAGSVLEIGCGSGGTLGWLRETGCASSTVGIEIVEWAAEQARSHADVVHCLDLERNELPADLGSFDTILCLDVLEHMVDPWHVLDKLVSGHLRPGGTLVVSLPNVRHYSVVFPLLFAGRWTYEESGLLDRTHLRFFTKNTAVELMAHPLLGSVRSLPKALWTTRKGLFNLMTLGVFRELVTYQLVLSASKKES